MFVKEKTSSGTVFHDVPWAYYVHTRDEVDAHTQVTYDRGRMEIMSPTSLQHDEEKKVIARLFEAYCFIFDIPLKSVGAPTLARESLKRGCEPDESYYVLADRPPPGTRDIDLEIYNPPDLVIEVDLTSHSVSKEPIYAAMGVAELWRWEKQELGVLQLREDGARYDRFETSALMPDLPLTVLAEHVRLTRLMEQEEVMKRWKDFIIKKGRP